MINNKWLVQSVFACKMVIALVACAPAPTHTQPRDVEVVLQEFAYAPTIIEAERNEPLRLRLKNTGTVLHDFNIPQLPLIAGSIVVSGGSDASGHQHHGSADSVHLALDAGKEGILQFTPSEAGKYEIACTVEGHRELGMVATLIVRSEE